MLVSERQWKRQALYHHFCKIAWQVHSACFFQCAYMMSRREVETAGMWGRGDGDRRKKVGDSEWVGRQGRAHLECVHCQCTARSG
jgi:hypothetical protein